MGVMRVWRDQMRSRVRGSVETQPRRTDQLRGWSRPPLKQLKIFQHPEWTETKPPSCARSAFKRKRPSTERAPPRSQEVACARLSSSTKVSQPRRPRGEITADANVHTQGRLHPVRTEWHGFHEVGELLPSQALGGRRTRRCVGEF